MQAQIEILASLQTVDREIREQTGRKQRLLEDLRVTERQIQAKKGEIDALSAAWSEREKLRVEKDRELVAAQRLTREDVVVQIRASH